MKTCDEIFDCILLHNQALKLRPIKEKIILQRLLLNLCPLLITNHVCMT